MCQPLAGRLRLAGGQVIITESQPVAAQAGPSAPGSRGQTRAPRVRPAVVRKKRKAGETEEDGGGEIGTERPTKVFTSLVCSCSPLLMGDVFYRERSATAVRRSILAFSWLRSAFMIRP